MFLDRSSRVLAALALLALLSACGAAPTATGPDFGEPESIISLAGNRPKIAAPVVTYVAADSAVYKTGSNLLSAKFPDAEIATLKIDDRVDGKARYNFEATFKETLPAPAQSMTWKTRGLFNSKAPADEAIVGAARPLNPHAAIAE